MRCPNCGCVEDKVVDTRVGKENRSIRRRRECIKCGNRFTTNESIIRAEFTIVKRDGTRDEFNPEKLRDGMLRACWKRPVSPAQVDKAVRNVTSVLEALQQREISSLKVGELVMNELRKIDHVAFVRFASVYRQFEDIDEFVNEIHRLTGTNQDTVEHES